VTIQDIKFYFWYFKFFIFYFWRLKFYLSIFLLEKIQSHQK